jgi:hypothetical protein
MNRTLRLAALLLTITAPLSAQRTVPLVLKLPATARVLALGGAQVALRDADAVFGNPALVGTATAFALGGERYQSGATAGTVLSSSTIGPVGYGVGIHLLEATDTTSLAATAAASLTWKQIRWGLAAKYIAERALTDDATGVSFDVGASKSLSFWNSTIGVAVQHIGPDFTANGRSVELPTQLALGMASGTRPIGRWIDFSGAYELNVRRDGDVFTRGGVEVAYVPLEGVTFTGRVGRRRPQSDQERALTLGGGFAVDRVSLDYGWEALRGGAGHRVMVRVR